MRLAVWWLIASYLLQMLVVAHTLGLSEYFSCLTSPKEISVETAVIESSEHVLSEHGIRFSSRVTQLWNNLLYPRKRNEKSVLHYLNPIRTNTTYLETSSENVIHNLTKDARLIFPEVYRSFAINTRSNPISSIHLCVNFFATSPENQGEKIAVGALEAYVARGHIAKNVAFITPYVESVLAQTKNFLSLILPVTWDYETQFISAQCFSALVNTKALFHPPLSSYAYTWKELFSKNITNCIRALNQQSSCANLKSHPLCQDNASSYSPSMRKIYLNFVVLPLRYMPLAWHPSMNTSNERFTPCAAFGVEGLMCYLPETSILRDLNRTSLQMPANSSLPSCNIYSTILQAYLCAMLGLSCSKKKRELSSQSDENILTHLVESMHQATATNQEKIRDMVLFQGSITPPNDFISSCIALRDCLSKNSSTASDVRHCYLKSEALLKHEFLYTSMKEDIPQAIVALSPLLIPILLCILSGWIRPTFKNHRSHVLNSGSKTTSSAS